MFTIFIYLLGIITIYVLVKYVLKQLEDKPFNLPRQDWGVSRNDFGRPYNTKLKRKKKLDREQQRRVHKAKRHS